MFVSGEMLKAREGSVGRLRRNSSVDENGSSAVELGKNGMDSSRRHLREHSAATANPKLEKSPIWLADLNAVVIRRNPFRFQQLHLDS